jgi:hypothetical protein
MSDETLAGNQRARFGGEPGDRSGVPEGVTQPHVTRPRAQSGDAKTNLGETVGCQVQGASEGALDAMIAAADAMSSSGPSTIIGKVIVGQQG